MKHFAISFALFLLPMFQLYAQDTMVVSSGWNIVGAISTRATNEFRSEPPGIILSSFYRFQSGAGYSQVDTLKKGSGYWVKTTHAGILLDGAAPESTCTAMLEYGGKIYHGVQIGYQCWFQENLDIGIMIDSTIISFDDEQFEKYCYHDEPENCSTYGGLYLWDEAMDYSTSEGARGICPIGWHIPTYDDFQTLKTTVGNDGNALKEIGEGIDAGEGTNTSGFSGLLSGVKLFNGLFYLIGSNAVFGSSTEYNGSSIYTLTLSKTSGTIGISGNSPETGVSIRCLKD